MWKNRAKIRDLYIMSQIAQCGPAALYGTEGFKFALCCQRDAKQNAFLTTLKYFSLVVVFLQGISMTL